MGVLNVQVQMTDIRQLVSSSLLRQVMADPFLVFIERYCEASICYLL